MVWMRNRNRGYHVLEERRKFVAMVGGVGWIGKVEMDMQGVI